MRYAARRFAPIYQTLFDSLADAASLSGDDTSCRVIEVSRHFAKQSNDEVQPPPGHGYRNAEAARELLVQGDDSLAAALASELGFEHERRNDDGTKKALPTTTLSGRSDPGDPRSLVVFYRSHLGGFGDVLQILLSRRSPKDSALTTQSDLATVNLVADQEPRRPDLLRRDAPPVQGAVSDRWSRETKVGEGTRYVTRNFDELTAYLDDPRLELTNNFAERMLRMETLIENGSLSGGGATLCSAQRCPPDSRDGLRFSHEPEGMPLRGASRPGRQWV